MFRGGKIGHPGWQDFLHHVRLRCVARRLPEHATRRHCTSWEPTWSHPFFAFQERSATWRGETQRSGNGAGSEPLFVDGQQGQPSHFGGYRDLKDWVSLILIWHGSGVASSDPLVGVEEAEGTAMGLWGSSNRQSRGSFGGWCLFSARTWRCSASACLGFHLCWGQVSRGPKQLDELSFLYNAIASKGFAPCDPRPQKTSPLQPSCAAVNLKAGESALHLKSFRLRSQLSQSRIGSKWK